MLDTNNNISPQTAQTLPLTDSDKAQLRQRGLTPKQIEAVSRWRFNRIVREARARRDARNAQRKAVAKMKLSTLFSAYGKAWGEVFFNAYGVNDRLWLRRIRLLARLSMVINRRIAALEAAQHG